MTPRALALYVALAGCSAGEPATGANHASTGLPAADRGIPDGAIVFGGTLPECRWPAALDPIDGGIPLWSVSRTGLACGSCVAGVYGDCTLRGADSGTFGGLAPCVMACEPGQYAVSSKPRWGPLPDAALVPQPVLPPSCAGPTNAVYLRIANTANDDSAEPLGMTTACCTCE